MGVQWLFPAHAGKHVRTDPPLVPRQRKAEPSALRRLIRWKAGTGPEVTPAAEQNEGTRT